MPNELVDGVRSVWGKIRRGVERGEVRPDAVTPSVAAVLPAMLMHRVILQRERIAERDIKDVIDQIIIPLVAVP